MVIILLHIDKENIIGGTSSSPDYKYMPGDALYDLQNLYNILSLEKYSVSL